MTHLSRMIAIQALEGMSRSEGEAIRDVALWMRADNIGTWPIGENEQPRGIVTDQTLCAVAERAAGRNTVRQVMFHDVFYCFGCEGRRARGAGDGRVLGPPAAVPCCLEVVVAPAYIGCRLATRQISPCSASPNHRPDASLEAAAPSGEVPTIRMRNPGRGIGLIPEGLSVAQREWRF